MLKNLGGNISYNPAAPKLYTMADLQGCYVIFQNVQWKDTSNEYCIYLLWQYIVSYGFNYWQKMYTCLEEERYKYTKYTMESDFLMKLTYLCNIFILKFVKKTFSYQKKLQITFIENKNEFIQWLRWFTLVAKVCDIQWI